MTLPGYPFERKAFWFETTLAPECRSARWPTRWPAVVAAGCRQADQVPIDLNLHTFEAKYEALDRLSTAYIIRALRSLGAFAVAGQALRVGRPRRPVWGPADLSDPHGSLVPPARRQGAAPRCMTACTSPTGRYRSRSPERSSSRRVGSSTMDPSCSAGCRRVVRCWTASSPERKARSTLLFPGGSSDLADEIYTRTALSRYFNSIALGAVEAFIAGTSPGRPVRILEVGAGTGGTTAVDPAGLACRSGPVPFHGCVRLLPGAGRAAVPGFPVCLLRPARPGKRPARARLCRRAVRHRARGQCLARDPRPGADGRLGAISPGAGRHAPACTRSRIRRRTSTRPWRCIEGWQIFNDGLRVDSPLLNTPQWLELLRARGFVEAVAFPATSSPAGVIGSHVFVARVPGGVAAAGRRRPGRPSRAEWRPPERGRRRRHPACASPRRRRASTEKCWWTSCAEHVTRCFAGTPPVPSIAIGGWWIWASTRSWPSSCATV